MQNLGTTPDMIIWPEAPDYDRTSSTDLPKQSPYTEESKEKISGTTATTTA